MKPLSSLKILDLTTLVPGPLATMMLADMGANVVRIEAPHRPDAVRFLPPFDGDISAWHAILNRNKRSIALDLKQPEAIEIVKRLVQTYDIVVEQFRPGVMDRLGIGYEALKAVNPRLIYCAITGYGQTGPYKDRAGHDNNFVALSGAMSYSGRRDQGPPPLGFQLADLGGSMGAITGILAAVIQRTATGEGQMVDISMFDMAVAWQAHLASNYLAGGEVPAREQMLLNGAGIYDYYETSDGRFLAVASLEPKFWQGFCQAIQRPDLIEPGMSMETAVLQQVKTDIRVVIAGKTWEEWTAVFANLDVCVEPVLTIPEMVEHPHTQARGLIVNVPRPNGMSQRQVGSPIRFSASEAEYRGVGTAVGAHTEEVLLQIGYNQKEFDTLQEAKTFG
ncbi:MAG: CoA transferase [Ardenticatenaceae bacterium]|nr:CoA transferase [Ardenticatenaceae bacterium]MCB9446210.1 CoA transferase [Ardenticatenaceae bacterium]